MATRQAIATGTRRPSTAPPLATASGDGTSPAASAAEIGSLPGRAAETASTVRGRMAGSLSRQRSTMRSKVRVQKPQGLRRQRQQALAAALARDANLRFGKRNVVRLQAHRLARAQPVERQQGDQGQIAAVAEAFQKRATCSEVNGVITGRDCWTRNSGQSTRGPP